mmetsp:Transcript_22465/g.48795  ORF Transcript_22465/g.48795 Transcript_22465/m.48795 type:complete len:519 (+) Transcript_22465:253-1809(+)
MASMTRRRNESPPSSVYLTDDGAWQQDNSHEPMHIVSHPSGTIQHSTNNKKRKYWRPIIRLSKQAGVGGTFIALILAYALWSLAAALLFHPREATGRRRRLSSNIMTRMGYEARPKVFAYYFEEAASSQLSSKLMSGALPLDIYLHPSKAEVEWTEEDENGQRRLLNSQYYGGDEHRALRPYQDNPECVPMHEWQTRSFPTCNNVHQIDFNDLDNKKNQKYRQVSVLAHGYFRDVWGIREFDGITMQAFKTLRFRHSWDEWNFERHRVDAVTFEVLTSSPRILDIYSFCGNSGAFEYAPGGTVSDILYDDKVLPIEERFNIAVQISRAIADLHNFNHKAPAIAHADIYTNQFVNVNGRYKLNDFNRATFLYWNSTSNAGYCPYVYGDYNAWLFRSPEEYEYSLQTEKIDVYSMGNIFYSLLMNEDPFEKEYDRGGSSRVRRIVKRGDRPTLGRAITKSSDPIEKALIKAMSMCHVHDWRERANSEEVSDFLSLEWAKCLAQKRCEPGPDDEGFEVAKK